jgi:hypothetical protein
MQFDLESHNIPQIWMILLVLLTVNGFFVVRRRMILLDPLVYLLFFISTINAFLLESWLADHDSGALYFLANGLFTNLALLLMPRDQYVKEQPPKPDRWIWMVIVLCLVRLVLLDAPRMLSLLRLGYVDAISETVTNNTQSVNIPNYILGCLLDFFQTYVFCYNIFFGERKWRKIVGVAGIGLGIISGYLGGSRAALFYSLLAIGQFLVYFRHLIDFRRYWLRIALIGSAAAGVFVVIMALYSSIGTGVEGVDFSQGLRVVQNRTFANVDGVQYFLTYEKDFPPSLYNFIKYNFIIIVKRITGEHYDNLGRRLYQDALGKQVDFGGPNFMILLQARIIAGSFGFLYILAVVSVFHWSRRIYAARGTLLDIVIFNLCYGMVWFFIDSETQFLRLGVSLAILSPLILVSAVVERWPRSVRVLKSIPRRQSKNTLALPLPKQGA